MAKRRRSQQPAANRRQYHFKKNRYIPSAVQEVGPQAVGEAVEAASEHGGIVNKERLIQQARPDAAPLHPCFESRDPVAAQEWRKLQASNIVNVVTVQATPEMEAPAFPIITMPTVVNEEGESGPPVRRNIAIQNIMDDPELRQQMINEALAKLIRVREEYRHLNELAIVWEQIDQARQAAMGSAT